MRDFECTPFHYARYYSGRLEYVVDYVRILESTAKPQPLQPPRSTRTDNFKNNHKIQITALLPFRQFPHVPTYNRLVVTRQLRSSESEENPSAKNSEDKRSGDPHTFCCSSSVPRPPSLHIPPFFGPLFSYFLLIPFTGYVLPDVTSQFLPVTNTVELDLAGFNNHASAR